MVAKVFIDGESGTTGLQIHKRLAARDDVRLLGLDPARRKDENARRGVLNEADVVILCLPDEAAREAVALLDNPATRVIDASTAHRTAPGWTYGFPEMTRTQRAAITAASRIANPGCWPTGFIALARPLVEAGLAPRDWPVTVGGVSGYSGGGKAMIAEFEDQSSFGYVRTPYRLYGLGMGHKHTPEMQRHVGLAHPPLFSPAVGRYYQGMLVEVPLPLYALPAAPSLADVHAALADAYAGEPFIEVVPLARSRSLATIDPEGVNGTNHMRLHVFGGDGQARLVALLDNLGKGAAGAAVQTLNLLLGLPEATGL